MEPQSATYLQFVPVRPDVGTTIAAAVAVPLPRGAGFRGHADGPLWFRDGSEVGRSRLSVELVQFGVDAVQGEEASLDPSVGVQSRCSGLAGIDRSHQVDDRGARDLQL